MIKSRCSLYALLVIFVYMETCYSATKVFYEFHIRDNNTQRNETGVLRNGTELVITGKRKSSVQIMEKDSNASNYAYQESAEYVADNNGYRVKYNFSLLPIELESRLGAKTLQILAG